MNIAASPSSAASASPSSTRTSVRATLAPSRTMARACDAPCPREPPVTIATLPDNLPDIVLLSTLRSQKRALQSGQKNLPGIVPPLIPHVSEEQDRYGERNSAVYFVSKYSCALLISPSRTQNSM